MSASLSKKAGIIIAGSLLQRIFSFLLMLVLARLLTKSEYGTFQQCMLVGTIIYGLIGVGNISSAILYFQPISTSRKEGFGYISTVITSLFLSGFLFATALVFLAPEVGGFMKGNVQLQEMLPFYAAYMFFWIAGDYVQSSFFVRDRVFKSVLLSVPDGLIGLASLAVPVYITGSLKAGLVGLMIFGMIKYLFYSLDYFNDVRIFNPSWECGKKVFEFTWPLSLSGIFDMMNNTIGKVLISRGFNAANFAIFSVGTIYFPFWQIVVKSVNTVLRMSLPTLIKEGRREEVVNLWNSAVRKQSLIMVPIYMFLLVFSLDFILLAFGDKYSDAVNVFRLTFLDKPLQLYSSSILIISGDKNKFLVSVSIIGLIINVLACFYFIGAFGLYGPVLAGALSMFAQEISINYYVVRRMKIGIFNRTTWFNLLTPILASGVSAFVVFLMFLSTPVRLDVFILKGVVYLAITSAVLVVTGLVRKDEVSALLSYVKGGRKI
jgi:O-antigen/teichoic acid export membrane protein